jgi:hypothetical protein
VPQGASVDGQWSTLARLRHSARVSQRVRSVMRRCGGGPAGSVSLRNTRAIREHTATYCPQCQVRRDQTIVPMDGARIATVTCTTCGRLATFTPPAAAPKARSSRARQGADVPPSVAPRWETKMAAATGKEHRYTMTATYGIGNILLHAQFGKGVVVQLATKKCPVLFQDKERLLASANEARGHSRPSRRRRGHAPDLDRERAGKRRIPTLPIRPAPRCPGGFERCCAKRTLAISLSFPIAHLMPP